MPNPFFTRPNFEDRQIVQYTGTSITLSGDTNINYTGNFRIYKDAFPGLVATSLDNDGTVGWGPISGGSFTGNTSGSCINDLYVHNLYGCSPIMVHDVLSGNSTTNYLDLSSDPQNLTLYNHSTSYGGTTNYLKLGDNAGIGTAKLSGNGSYLDLGSGSAFLNAVNGVYLSTDASGYFWMYKNYGFLLQTPNAGSSSSTFLLKSNNSGGQAMGGSDLQSGAHQGELITGIPATSVGLGSGVMGTGLGNKTTGFTGQDYQPVFISTPRSRAYDLSDFSTIKNVLFGGGSDNKVYTGVTNSALIGGSGNTINSYIKNSVVLGGESITATTSNTVYVPNLNIKTIGVGTSVNNLGIDSNGNVVVGSASSGSTSSGGITIDPYYQVGTGSTFTWVVSGGTNGSTNYETTISANTTVNLTNVINGHYGTLILHQDSVGSRTLTFGTVNGGSVTHRVVNGGGGLPVLTSNAYATDILSFTYNGSSMFWTVGNDYT